MKRIEEIIELIEITGDKCIILHQERNSAYVVMKLEDYKRFYQTQISITTASVEKKQPSMNNQKETTSLEAKIKPIPRLPANIQEFEIKTKLSNSRQDIYYPEPLME